MEGFYYLSWAVYLLSAVLIAVGFWRLVRHINRPLQRNLLLGLVLAVLLTPCEVVPHQEALAPALFVAVLDGLSQETRDVWRGVLPILSTYGIIIVLLLAFRVVAGPGRQGGSHSKGPKGVKVRRGTATKTHQRIGAAQGRPELELSMPPRPAYNSRLDGLPIEDYAGSKKSSIVQ